jgi:type III secretion protein L
MESVEGKMADIVMKALKSCVVEIGDSEMVVQIVRKTMKAVIRTQRQVTVKVAPDMVASVKARVDALRAEYPTIETLDVVEDSRLKGPACILETEAGVADASVDTQLAAIERSLQRHMAGNPAS